MEESTMVGTAAASGAAAKAQRLTGYSGDSSYFRFAEHHEFQPAAIVDVLAGRLMGVVFRAVIPAATRSEIVSRFWASSALKTRGSDAPGRYVGTYHYHKTTEEYLDETEAVAQAVRQLLDVPADPLTLLQDGLREVLAEQGVEFRLAQHNGRRACPTIARSWHGLQQYALAPHEDYGQCTEPRQHDFEIQGVADHHVVGFNVCLENDTGGDLVVWNVRPDEHSRRRLGLEYTGSPYPLDALTDIDSLTLPVRPGDVYLFNGSHVHAVEPGVDSSVRRITLSGIMGFIDHETVTSWT